MSIAISANAQLAAGKPEPIKLPIVSSPLTLTYFVEMNTNTLLVVKNYAEIACYKEMVKRTGITIKFLHPPAGQASEQYNLMIASKDLPDIIYMDWFSVPGGPGKAIADGSIIRLNDAIGRYAPNISKLYEDKPGVKKEVLLDDGSLYMFPFLNTDPYMRAGGPVIREDWLKKLGLASPVTMADWYQMLKAFKDRDPNGNGKADEVPLICKRGKDLESIYSFASPFGIILGFYNKNGSVGYGPIEKAYKDYLTTMNQWYREGLLDPEYATTDDKSFDAKVSGELGGAWIGRISGTLGRFLRLMETQNPKFSLMGAVWPVGPAGKSYNIRSNMATSAIGFGGAISTKNTHVKETVKWMDYQYSLDGQMLMNFGVEGLSYTMVNGYPTFTDLVMKNPEGLAMSIALSKYSTAPFNGTNDQDRRMFDQTLFAPQQKATMGIWAKGADVSLLLPPIMTTPDESVRMAAIMGDIETYFTEMMNKFIMGTEPLGKFDAYVLQMKKMGIDEALAMKQKALDRFLSRK